MKMANAKKAKRSVRFSIMDEEAELNKAEVLWGTLEKSVMNSVQDIRDGKKVTRLAFEENPKDHHWYGLWVPKQNQIPDFVLKRISTRDDLVAAILNARSAQISQFGRELQDRHAKGFLVEPRRGVMSKATPEQKQQIQSLIEEATRTLSTCGSIDGVEPDDRISLATFMAQQARNAALFGRFATEIMYTTEMDGSKKFHSFRPLDVGQIYRTPPRSDGGLDRVRQQALRHLEELNDEKLRPEKFEDRSYAWVQVINNQPEQAFTADECFVHNVYPVTDIELAGYPLTPIDCAIDAIMTHMNITNHNRLYFQSGRAARGMIVIKSADINQDIVAQIRQHFNASINGVQNSWRVPVFGIDPEEEISWEPLEMTGAGRDTEFQYGADMTCRVILSSFGMGPDELPGYGHLSKPTGQQSLSESNNEYQLESAKDTGLRPLLVQFQDFLNERILPLINPLVAKLCVIKLKGLDTDSPEKEQQRLIGNSTLHETYDSILSQVEKDPIGKEWGGEYPLSPGIQGVHDKYLPVGKIIEHFFGIPGAAKDPQYAYVRDPFWFNFQQLQLQQQQLQQQSQMASAGGYGEDPQGPDGGGGSDGGDQGGGDGGGEKKEPSGPGELESGVDQLMQMMNKSEAQLPAAKRRILAQHRATVKSIMDAWEKESKQTVADVLDVAKKQKPQKG